MCEHGSTVPMPINGRVRDIDSCLALLVATLNTVPAFETVACCCGHGRMPASVILHDDTWLVKMKRAEAEAFFARYGAPSPVSTAPDPCLHLFGYNAMGSCFDCGVKIGLSISEYAAARAAEGTDRG